VKITRGVVLGVGVGVGVTGVGVGVGVTGVGVGVGVIVGVGVFDGHNPTKVTSNGAPYCSTNIFLPQI
jgi:hypothetical protein